MTRSRLRVYLLLAAMILLGLGTPRVQASAPTYVYFDHTEEVDFWTTAMPPYAGLATQQLVKPWDPNGQLCLFPDGSGRFTSAYNPTGVDQTGPDGSQPNGGVSLPRKQPPVGVAVYNKDGTFTGTDLYVPGPYKLTSASSQWTSHGVVGPDAGGDIPPDSNNGPFNNEGTYTGCAFGAHANLFAVDIGTAQGAYPSPDSGRLIEWFADSNYRGVCIVYGPDKAGNMWPSGNTHHVDGTGGLQQPGVMASDGAGNIYVPVDEADPTTLLPQGKVLKFAASQLPATEKDCPNNTAGVANGDQTNYHVVTPSTFIDAAQAGVPFPAAIAWDPPCRCWAVDNVFFGPLAVEWFDTAGSPLGQTTHAPIPANLGGQFSPFGIAFDANGDLFAVDIHVQVDPMGTLKSQSLQAGPVNGQGRLLEFSFNGPVANPPTVIASGESFPVSVTTCDPNTYANCPHPVRPEALVSAAEASSSPAPGTSANKAPSAKPLAATGSSFPWLPVGATMVAAALGGRRMRRRISP